MKLIRTCVAAAVVLTPLFANAALGPGQYDISGIQQICLLDNGSWYGTTFPNWGGAYYTSRGKTFIYGNYADGVGNDSMDFYPNNHGPWTEWRDDLSHQIVEGVTARFVKADCDPPGAAVNGSAQNPHDQR